MIGDSPGPSDSLDESDAVNVSLEILLRFEGSPADLARTVLVHTMATRTSYMSLGQNSYPADVRVRRFKTGEA